MTPFLGKQKKKCSSLKCHSKCLLSLQTSSRRSTLPPLVVMLQVERRTGSKLSNICTQESSWRGGRKKKKMCLPVVRNCTHLCVFLLYYLQSLRWKPTWALPLWFDAGDRGGNCEEQQNVAFCDCRFCLCVGGCSSWLCFYLWDCRSLFPTWPIFSQSPFVCSFLYSSLRPSYQSYPSQQMIFALNLLPLFRLL